MKRYRTTYGSYAVILGLGPVAIALSTVNSWMLGNWPMFGVGVVVIGVFAWTLLGTGYVVDGGFLVVRLGTLPEADSPGRDHEVRFAPHAARTDVRPRLRLHRHRVLREGDQRVAQGCRGFRRSALREDGSASGTGEDASGEQQQRRRLTRYLRRIEPSTFERLCQRLLREHGFRRVEVTGRSGDGGIDGTGILQLNLLSFHVNYQCKRYAGTVGPGSVSRSAIENQRKLERHRRSRVQRSRKLRVEPTVGQEPSDD